MRRRCVDVCVVGSGAGGSVVALEAARKGLRTLVLERGPRMRPADMTHNELRMIPSLYKDGGMQLNASMDLFVLQGTVVGGSSVLSNMVMLRADPSVFAQWRGLGANIATGSMNEAYAEVEEELEVRQASRNTITKSSRRFFEGADQLGLSPSWMQKAVGGCLGCGQCNVGCTFGTKKSADLTYLAQAESAGAEVLPEALAEKLEHRAGAVRGVRVRVGRGGEELLVQARVVVVAGGAIGSSGLLLASGVTKHIGTRVSFNAATALAGDFEDELDGFDGDQMTACVRTPNWLLEATHNPPMSAALTTAGWGGDHGRQMQRLRHLAYVGCIVPTAPVGRVRLSRFTQGEEILFKMPSADLANLEQANRQAAQVLFAAGARSVAMPTHRLRSFADAEELRRTPRLFRSIGEISCGSSHPQGGNPMSDDPELGAVDSSLVVHGFDNLFVCDASVFPTALGVNPINTIFALAKVKAPGIVARA
ncbi:MAG: GMC family oxidoreductase [Polyangiaceae bacterium]|nr:GMC family oxidoreductase [Polyangiaceae bacterium]